MVQVQVSPDCGNAPKRQVLRDFSIAVAEHNTEALLSTVADDVEWDIVGQRVIQGKTDVVAALDSAVGRQVVTLHLDSIITHGKEGSVSSRMAFSEGSDLRCCDVYEFSGHSKTAKIKRITSYWIEA